MTNPNMRGIYQSNLIQDKRGNLLTNNEDQIKRLTEHFKEVPNSPVGINNLLLKIKKDPAKSVYQINGIRMKPPSRSKVKKKTKT